jgi:hypothetical protein
MHRSILHHLQLMAVQQKRSGLLASVTPRGFSALAVQPWRNVAVNGMAIPPEALPDLSRVTLPRSGVVTLDYVSYRVRYPRHIRGHEFRIAQCNAWTGNMTGACLPEPDAVCLLYTDA